MDRYELSDVVEDCVNFLKQIEELKPYIVKFHNNDAMKPKVYLFDYTVRDENCQPIIIITHDEYTFSKNNGV